MQQELFELSTQLGKILSSKHLTVSSAESCTGGLLGHVLTGVSGSSEYYLGGIIAYSNQVKESLLGVRPETLAEYGAVSEQTAREMASGVREKLGADIGLATTGIAGPTGGTAIKPVGLVWIGTSTNAKTEAFECQFKGEREEVKNSTVNKVLRHLIDLISKNE